MPLAQHEAQIRRLIPSRKPSSPCLFPEGEGRGGKVDLARTNDLFRALFNFSFFPRLLLPPPSATDRNVDEHFSSFVGPTIDSQSPADLRRASTHADQTAVIGLAIRRDFIIEPDAVIAHV